MLLMENKIKVQNQAAAYSCSPGPFTVLRSLSWLLREAGHLPSCFKIFFHENGRFVVMALYNNLHSLIILNTLNKNLDHFSK